MYIRFHAQWTIINALFGVSGRDAWVIENEKRKAMCRLMAVELNF